MEIAHTRPYIIISCREHIRGDEGKGRDDSFTELQPSCQESSKRQRGVLMADGEKTESRQ